MTGRATSVAVLLAGAMIPGALAGRATAGEIHQAAEDNDLPTVKRLLEQTPALIRARDDMQRTPLHKAARFASKEMVAYLLAKGADVNARCYNRFTPLHLTSDPEIAKLLVANEADLEADSAAGTPLEKAVNYKNMRLIAVLQEAGQKLDIDSLVKLGYTERVAALLKEKPWLAKPPRDCLSRAALNGNLELVKLLLDHGADPNYSPSSRYRVGNCTALSSAVMRGYHEIVRLMLERGARANVSAYIGKTGVPLIYYAVVRSDVRILKLLLARRPDVNVWTRHTKQTPLHAAVTANDLEKVRLLIKYGAEVNASPGDGATPLFYGAVRGHKELCKLLVSQGARPGFHTACALGMKTEVESMLAADAGLATRPDKRLRREPLFYAVMGGDSKVVDLLLRSGANVNARGPEFSKSDLWVYQSNSAWKENVGETPLHVAGERGTAEIARILLEGGAKLNAVDYDGDTPLHRAAEAGNLPVLRVLLERGARVDVTNRDGWSPLAHAVLKDAKSVETILKASPRQATLDAALSVAAGCEESRRAARLLVERGAVADMYAACFLGLTERAAELLARDPGLANKPREDYPREPPLCTAARNGRAEIVDLLLVHKANIEGGGKRSPLGLAAAGGHLNVVKLLTDRGANVAATPGWRADTAFHRAARGGHTAVIEFLLERGAKLHGRDKQNATALHKAAQGGDVRTIEFLIGRGIPVDAKNKGFRTALHDAARYGWPDAVAALLKRGADASAKDWKARTALQLAEEKPVGQHLDEKADREAAAEVLRTHLRRHRR